MKTHKYKKRTYLLVKMKTKRQMLSLENINGWYDHPSWFPYRIGGKEIYVLPCGKDHYKLGYTTGKHIKVRKDFVKEVIGKRQIFTGTLESGKLLQEMQMSFSPNTISVGCQKIYREQELQLFKILANRLGYKVQG